MAPVSAFSFKLYETVDPDAWLIPYHRRVFKRKVARNGTVSVGNHDYYVDYRLAKETVGFQLDATLAVFNIIHKGKFIQQTEIQGLVKQPMNFQDFVRSMLEQARTNK